MSLAPKEAGPSAFGSGASCTMVLHSLRVFKPQIVQRKGGQDLGGASFIDYCWKGGLQGRVTPCAYRKPDPAVIMLRFREFPPRAGVAAGGQSMRPCTNPPGRAYYQSVTSPVTAIRTRFSGGTTCRLRPAGPDVRIRAAYGKDRQISENLDG